MRRILSSAAVSPVLVSLVSVGLAAAQPLQQAPEVLAQLHGVFTPLPSGLSGEIAGAPDMLLPADAPPGFEPRPREGIVRHRRASIDFGLLSSRLAGVAGASAFMPGAVLDEGPIVFNFFDDLVVSVEDPVVERSPNLDAEGWVLSGRVAGTLEHVHFVVHTAADGGIEAVAAAASLSGRRVEARSDSTPGVYLIEELAPPVDYRDVVVEPFFDEEDSPLLQPLSPDSDLQPQGPTFIEEPSRSSSSCAGSIVDVLILTTTWFRSQNGGASGADSSLALLVSRANTALSNSGVQHCILHRSFHADWYDILDVERLTDYAALSRLATRYGALRTAYGADLIHLVTEDNLSRPDSRGSVVCGIAYIGPSSGRSAGITSDGGRCASTDTFAHELGHNFGLKHDRHTNFGAGGIAAWSRFGYGFSRADLTNVSGLPCWYTVMAYFTHCDTDGAVSKTRIQYFSNLTVTHPTSGEALGQTGAAETNRQDGPADAASVLKTNMPTVAAFKTKVSSPSYVDLDFTGAASVSPSNACFNGPVTVSATVINKGTAASASFTATVYRRWRRSSSSAWQAFEDLAPTRPIQPALAAGATSVLSFNVHRGPGPGQEYFALGVFPSDDVDRSLAGEWTNSPTASISAVCGLFDRSVAVNGAIGFTFDVATRFVPGGVIESQPHDLRISWTPASQYLDFWLFIHTPGSAVADENGWGIRTSFAAVGGEINVRLPLSVWRHYKRSHWLALRNQGGYPWHSGGAPDSAITADVSVTYIVPSSSSYAPPDGASLLPDGSGFGIPVELTPIDPALAEELVELGMRLSPSPLHPEQP